MSRALQPGEREEFRVSYWSDGPPEYQWLCEIGTDRDVSVVAAANIKRDHGFKPLYRVRVIWKAPPAKPKRDLHARLGYDGYGFDCWQIFDGSDYVEGGFTYRSSAEDRIAELLEEG